MKKYEVKEGNHKTFITEYENINNFLKDIESKETTSIFKGVLASQSTYRTNWYGTKNYDEAKNLLFNGWESGAKELNTKLKIANSKMQDKVLQRAVYDLVGFQASVPRYLQGIPQNMINKRSVKQKAKVITLNKSVSYSARVKPEEIIEDSIKFLQIVQAIEKQNVRVNINLVWMVTKGSESVLYKIKLKSASERLNISKLSFPLIHPSFLRRIVFKALETEERITNNSWSPGYGMPQTTEQINRYLGKNEYTYNNLNKIKVEDLTENVLGLS